jgi:hypothetical protein
MKETLIGVVTGSILTAAVAGFVSAQTRVPPMPPVRSIADPAAGRYQIVNGTPEYAANIMLLDTATGDSWIKCASEEVGSLWCKMPRSNDATSPKK